MTLDSDKHNFSVLLECHLPFLAFLLDILAISLPVMSLDYEDYPIIFIQGLLAIPLPMIFAG